MFCSVICRIKLPTTYLFNFYISIFLAIKYKTTVNDRWYGSRADYIGLKTKLRVNFLI